MAYVYDNKTYRNLQQQVKENMDDIARLQSLKLVGLDVAHIVDTEEDLADITAEQGMVVAVGTEQPYKLFVYNNSSWVDFGEFPKAGPQGEQGPQGQVGNPGPRGLTGEPGPRGYTGAQGPAGSPGPQGARGPQGPAGPKGDRGLVDAYAADAESITAVGQAYVDENGYLQVCTSLSPLTFEQGGSVKGPKGDTGEQGPQGIQGEQGAQGPTGATGPQGARGPQGQQGIRGPQGEQGIQGPQGETGATGPEGPQGPKGDTGAQGPTGPTGPQGPKGDPGLTASVEVNGQVYTTDSTGKITLPDYPADVAWGNITGTLSSQTDLQTALNAKADASAIPTNYVTTDTAQTIKGIKTFSGQLKANGGIAVGNGYGISGSSYVSGGYVTGGYLRANTLLSHTGWFDDEEIGRKDTDYDLKIYGNGFQIIDDEDADDDAPYYIGLPKDDGIIALTKNIPTTMSWSQITGRPTFATVATSGSYNDLSNKPTIPTVGNATLTIQKNGTNVDTFTANATSNKTINITVPTKTSDITNDSGFITSSAIPTNYVTTNTQQTINGVKNFVANTNFTAYNYINTDYISITTSTLSNNYLAIIPVTSSGVSSYCGTQLNPWTSVNADIINADDINATNVYANNLINGTNTIAVANIVSKDEIYYKDGDKYKIRGNYNVTGYMTSGSKFIGLIIHTPKSLANITSITVNKLSLIFRSANGGYINGGGYIDYAATTGYTVVANISEDNAVYIGITATSEFTNALNNSPVNAQAIANGIELTFNA